MNKPYFAKYLPVEGEIKESDKYIATTQDAMKLFPNVLVAKKDSYILLGYQGNFKKVKLFLCSRDIQVGDKVYRNDSKINESFIVGSFLMSGETRTGWYAEGFAINPKKKLQGARGIRNYGKIIGEISSEATWVTEGDEFDEDELQSVWRRKEGHVEYLPLFSKPSSPNKKKENWIRIKGPCGHFH